MIGRVLHKTHIDVDAEGTKAAAATAATITFKGMPLEPERKTVILNRPFLYMIVDTNTNLPMFIGTVQNLPEQ
jgi:serpin B